MEPANKTVSFVALVVLLLASWAYLSKPAPEPAPEPEPEQGWTITKENITSPSGEVVYTFADSMEYSHLIGQFIEWGE